MSNDKMRDQFEAWVKANWPAQSLTRFSLHFKENEGEYTGFTVQHCWDAWQASRSAIEIELPPMPTAQRTDEEATYSVGGCDMRRKCVKSIEAAGLKVAQ